MADQLYVDKTDLVYKIASVRRKYFFSRPRRFGKSLLISTFEALFKYGVKYFEGLAIEKLWKEHKEYKIVRLDFSEIKPLFGLNKFCKDLTGLIIDKFSSLGFEYKSSELSLFRQLSSWMEEQEPSSLVILIDEYDAPLTSCLNDPILFEQIRSLLAEFYSVIKANDSSLRFVFITGNTKFNKKSIFSELNNLKDLTLDVGFGTLLGYTHDEIQRYFLPYLHEAASTLNISDKELLEKLTRQYDGFCFERTASKHVFAPWSLLNFFSYPENGLVDYWFESGGKPSILVEYLKSHALRHPEEYSREKTISLSELSGSADIQTVSDLGLLVQAGYLTIKSVEYGDTVYLDYPNLEVRRAMATLYLERLLSGRVAGQVGAGPIVKVLSEENTESLFHILNRLFSSIDYYKYPVRDEASLRAYVQVYMAGAGLEPKIEHHNAFGRSDLEVRAGERHWILELKVVRGEESSKEKLREGVAQMLSRHYGDEAVSKEKIRAVLVYSIEKKQFVKWQEVSS